MRHIADHIGYELGNFLPPRYSGYEKSDVFFLLLQNPTPNYSTEKFSVKLGKTRFLNGEFYTDCLKALLYFAIDGGRFFICDIQLNVKKDGSKFFDAIAFLDQMGVEYEVSDVSHYRYFKSRLYECKRELILNEDPSKFFIIRRRISPDDFERVEAHYNHEKSILQQGFFLLTNAHNPPLIEYRWIEYFRTKKELIEYIQHEYSGTDAEIITMYSFSELLNGQMYKVEHRQGAALSDIYITIIHDTNLDKLYRFLDCAEVTDDEGNTICLSEHMKAAENTDEILEIICIFNESQDNYWL